MAQVTRYLWLTTPLSLAALAWGGGAAGVFDSADGAAYDVLLRARARLDREPPRVLLVEAGGERGKTGDSDLAAAVRKLSRLGARAIGFTFLPEAGASSFYREVAARGNVVLPVPLLAAAGPGEVRIAEAPELEAHGPLKLGVVRAPPASGGVARRHPASYTVSGVLYPSLAAQAASLALGELEVPASGAFLIRFRGGPGSLPNVPIGRVLSDDLIEEMVKGRLVLVGLARGPSEPGIATPTTAGQAAMSLLEHEGHALDTLVTGSAISEAPGLWRLAWVAAGAVVTAWACRRASLRSAPWIVAGAAALQGSVTGLLLVSGGVWLPPAAAAACQGALLVAGLRGKALEATASVRRLVADSSIRLRDRCWPASPGGAPASWSLVANMVNQTLDLSRLIFLEADSSQRRVREILALHSSLGDIAENRRDLTRPPYLDAIHAKGPVVVEGYFKVAEPGERQYLIPLKLHDDILGFWALGIDQGKAGAIPGFEGLLKDYASRMAELLYQARQPGAGREPAGAAGAPRAGQLEESMGQGLVILRSLLHLLQERLGSLDCLVDSLGSGVIVFDIFGRILQINDLMLTLLKKERLAPFEMTALDIIMALSDYDISRARKLLRRVIVESSPVSFPVTLRSTPSSRYLIHLKPIAGSPGRGPGGGAREAASRTVLCELQETTSTALLYELKSRLTQRLCLQLRSDLAPIDLSASILHGKGLDPERRHRMAEAIRRSVNGAVRRLAECQGFLDADADMDELERFPIDPRPALDLALEEVRAAAPASLSFQVKEPSFVSYVFASSSKLKEFFKAVLLCLCQDAAEASTVLVRVTESEDVVAFDFSNMGFGIPDELLQGYVHGGQPVATPELQTLQAGAKWIASWGGVLEAFSGVGVGMHFTVHLVKHV